MKGIYYDGKAGSHFIVYEKVQFEVFGLDLEGIFGKEFPDVYDPRQEKAL